MMKDMRVLMTGGGTLGPVTPLLAIAGELRRRDPNAYVNWIGTPSGPERLLVESNRIPFTSLSAPKLDRYRKWTWPFVPIALAAACVKAFRLLRASKPDVVMTAGAFVSVPVVWMAWVLRIPVWLHQLDVQVGVANKVMAPFATRVSVTFEDTAAAFAAAKTMVVGGMIRKTLRSGERAAAMKRYGFDDTLPTVLVIGGGTGAQAINEAFAVIRKDLVGKVNVIHLVGRGKMLGALEEPGPNYVALEFLNEGMADAYAAADVVVCRGGFGTMCELAGLAKPAVVIPITGDAFQESNAKFLEEHQAAEVLWYLTPQILAQTMLRLVESFERRDALAKNIRSLFPVNADERIVHELLMMMETTT